MGVSAAPKSGSSLLVKSFRVHGRKEMGLRGVELNVAGEAVGRR